MTLRTRNRGRTGLKDTALARFGFFAHLRTHVMLAKGVGAPSFTRATVATVKDFEGGIRNCLSGEVRFEGQRRVRNRLVGSSSEDLSTTPGGWALIGLGTGSVPTRTLNYAAAPDGTMTACRLQLALNGGNTTNDRSGMTGSMADEGAGNLVGSVWLKLTSGSTPTVIQIRCGLGGTNVTVTETWQRFSAPSTITTAESFYVWLRGGMGTADSADILVWHPMAETVTGQSNQNPSEYVSVGAAKLNEFTNSEDLTAVASWAPTRTTVTANGYQTLDTVLETAVVNTHELASAAISGISASTAYRLQFECKANGRDESWVQVSDGTQGAYGVFNATTGAFTTAWQGFGAAAFTGCASSIENRGDGVYRVTLDFTTAAATASLTTTFYLYNAGTSYLGDITKGWYLGKLMLRRGTGDYFPVGNVYPYHGACVDGVKYFATENPNVVIDNVVYDTSEQPYTSTKWLRLPGASGAYATTPSAAANQITTDIDIRVRVSAVDWTPAGNMMFVSKSDSTGTQRAYFFQLIVTTGRLNFGFSPDGTLGSQVTISSTASPTFDNGAAYWVRVTRDKATGTVTYYTAADSESEPTSWSTLGAAQVLSAGTGIFASSSIVEIGSTATGGAAQLAGNIYRAKIYNSIGGSAPVVDFNPSDSTVGGNAVFTSSTTGEVWTVNGTAAIRITPTGRLPRQLDGYAAAYKVQENSVSNTFSTLGTYQPRGDMAFWAEVALDNWVPSASNGIGRQWNEGSGRVWNLLIATDGKITVHASTDGNLPGAISSTNATGFAAGSKHFVGFTRVAATGLVSIYTSEDGVTWDLAGTGNSTAGNLWTNNSDFIRIGVSGAGGDFCMGGKIFRAKMFAQANFTSTPVLDFNPREGWTENKLTGSSDFSTAAWAASWAGFKAFGSGSTLNATTAPDGTLTADLLVCDTPNTAHNLLQLGTANTADGLHCVQICAKAAGYSYIAIGANGTTGKIVVNLTTGAVESTTLTAGNYGVKDRGNGWWEIWCIDTFSNQAAYFNVMSAAATFTFAGDGTSGVYLWGAQCRRITANSQRTTSGYLPTTSAALRGWISSTGEQWTMNGAASVLQRQAEGYLPEIATTNLCLYSSDFSNWTAGGTPTISSGAKRVGDIALDLIGDDNAAGLEYYFRTIGFTGDAQKSVSIIVAQGSSTASYINLQDNTAVAQRLQVDLTWSNGLPVCAFTTGSQERPPEALGNGAYRLFFLTTSVTAANSNALYVYPAATSAGSGTPTGTLYCGGVQAENATVASSLQPTTTGTAARNADALTCPSIGNAGSDGCMYGKAVLWTTTDAYLAAIHQTNSNPTLGLRKHANVVAIARDSLGGVHDPGAVSATQAGVVYKHALTWASNGSVANSINGGAVGTNSGMYGYDLQNMIFIGYGYAAAQLCSPLGPVMISKSRFSNTDIVAVSK